MDQLHGDGHYARDRHEDVRVAQEEEPLQLGPGRLLGEPLVRVSLRLAARAASSSASLSFSRAVGSMFVCSKWGTSR
ncbi:hypothetical protein [Streptomyces virginiae]|uniref:hypothetical protein n=1 Tax=Streptomyces virginiae TaxID=1961 RepID=UPI003251F80B